MKEVKRVGSKLLTNYLKIDDPNNKLDSDVLIELPILNRPLIIET
jgi:hypothetical protein